MHAVIVDGDLSYPPTSGKRLRTLNLMLRLARRHQVTYIGRFDRRQAESENAIPFLCDHGIETILVNHPLARKAGLALYGRLGANLLMSDLPYSVASHHSLPMCRAVTEYASKHAVDLWQFEWLPYMTTLRQTNARRVVIAHNVETMLWKRYYEAAKGPASRFFLKRQWRRMLAFERTHFFRASWIAAVSAEDACVIRDEFNMPRVDVVDNGIDRDYFADVQGDREANRILFLGALDWRPNLDGLELLLSRIFPQVRASEPSAKLCIVGRHPPAALVQRVQGLEGIELHADVPDVRPFLGQCGVMIVPLRIGGGSRLKILEALASGLPVISTAVGAEGLKLQPGQHFVRADGVEAMANVLVNAIRSPAPLREMAKKGRQVVLDNYDWDAQADKLEQVWMKCVGSEALACTSCS